MSTSGFRVGDIYRTGSRKFEILAVRPNGQLDSVDYQWLNKDGIGEQVVTGWTAGPNESEHYRHVSEAVYLIDEVPYLLDDIQEQR